MSLDLANLMRRSFFGTIRSLMIDMKKFFHAAQISTDRFRECLPHHSFQMISKQNKNLSLVSFKF